MSDTHQEQSIIEGLGGRSNIKDYFHCATRLRFTLYDYSLIDKNKLKAQPVILSVIEASGQCQLVIGTKVESVYLAIKDVIDSADAAKNVKPSPGKTSTVQKKEGRLDRVFGFISGSFLPVIGIISAAGLLRAMITVLQQFTYFQGSETLKIIDFIASVPFYYLPVILGFTISRQLKSNEIVGAAIGASLLYPDFVSMAGKTLHFIGLPVMAMNYASSVFPIFFAILLAAFLEKRLKKSIPDAIQLMAVPFVTLIVVVPLTLILLGPFGTYLGDYMAKTILYIINMSGLISGILIGAFYSFVVLFGLHWALMPIIITNLSHGGDPIYAIGGMSAIAQMGVALGIMIKTRNRKTRQFAGAAFFPALISGVTEPILYGLIVPHKRTIPFMLIAGAVGGGIIGHYGVKMNALVFSSLLAIPTAQNMLIYTVALFATLLTGALLVLFFGYQSESEIKES